MITEDYVSFETAKLLKEKGFDISTLMVYSQNGNFMPDGAIEDTYQVFYAAPTLQMAMKWLREVHKLWCEIAREGKKGDGTWYADVYSLEKEDYVMDGAIRHNIFSYEEACEAAIKYCLENLI